MDNELWVLEHKHACKQDNKCFNCVWYVGSRDDDRYWDRLVNRTQGGDPKAYCVLQWPNCPHGVDYGHGPIPPEPVTRLSEKDNGNVKVLSCDQWRKEYIDYKDYLNNWLWDSIKKAMYARSNYKCEICGTAKNLTVHHITYDRIGAEELSDLLVVCRNCHRAIHENDIERSGSK